MVERVAWGSGIGDIDCMVVAIMEFLWRGGCRNVVVKR